MEEDAQSAGPSDARRRRPLRSDRPFIVIAAGAALCPDRLRVLRGPAGPSHRSQWGQAALEAPPPAVLAQGTAAPDFSLPALDGGTPVSLGAFRGGLVLLSFFASWCPHCRQELASVAAVARMDAGKVAVVGVDSNESSEDSGEAAVGRGSRLLSRRARPGRQNRYPLRGRRAAGQLLAERQRQGGGCEARCPYRVVPDALGGREPRHAGDAFRGPRQRRDDGVRPGRDGTAAAACSRWSRAWGVRRRPGGVGRVGRVGRVGGTDRPGGRGGEGCTGHAPKLRVLGSRGRPGAQPGRPAGRAPVLRGRTEHVAGRTVHDQHNSRTSARTTSPPGPTPGTSSPISAGTNLFRLRSTPSWASPHYRPSSAPPFTLPGVSGDLVSVPARPASVVVLTFFDAPCNDICPVLASEIRGRGRRPRDPVLQVDFVTVNTDPAALAASEAGPAVNDTGLGSLPELAHGHGVAGCDRRRVEGIRRVDLARPRILGSRLTTTSWTS